MDRDTLRPDNSDVRERILRAARDLFFRQGYEGTRTRQIASQAKTSESGVLRIFPSKDAVRVEVYNDCWRQVNAEIEAHLAELQDPRRQILSILETLWRLYEKDLQLVSFIIFDINSGSVDSERLERKDRARITPENLRYVRRVEALCEECVSNSMTPAGLTARALSEAFLALSEGFPLGWYLADQEAPEYPAKVPIEQALAAASVLLFGQVNLD